VAIVPAVSSTPALDPIVYFDGGPGNSALLDANLLLAAGMNQDRELILMAARGTYGSQPALTCPELDDFQTTWVGLSFDSPSAKSQDVQATAQCRNRLAASGVDLAAYNSTEAAADYADLRTALRIPQWNVLAHSYGTDLGLIYMREHPQGIRSIVLDGVTPPSLATPGFAWSSYKEGLDAIFAACAAQPACQTRYPNIGATFTRLVSQLEAHPITTPVTLPGGGAPVNVVIDGGVLVNWVRAASSGGRAADMPMAIDELDHGDPQMIAEAWAAGRVTPPDQVGQFGYGFNLSVWCSEWVPYESASEQVREGQQAYPTFPASVQAQPPQLAFLREQCGAWNVPKAPASVRAITRSNIDTLVMTGTFDVATGPHLGTYAARTLPNSTVVVLAGVGHGVFTDPCGAKIESSFFDNPKAADTTCAASVHPPPFTIGPPLS
jgi:pimeloyl-ACP methyl ester carboxylesterase